MFDYILIPISLVLIAIFANLYQKFLVGQYHTRHSVKIKKKYKYDILFGESNWRIVNFKKNVNLAKSNIAYDNYEIFKTYNLEIIDQNKLPLTKLSIDQMKTVSKYLDRNDIYLLAENNPTLCEEMTQFLNFSEQQDFSVKLLESAGKIKKII